MWHFDKITAIDESRGFHDFGDFLLSLSITCPNFPQNLHLFKKNFNS